MHINEPQRPDLSHLDPEILAYIESLESEIDRLRSEHNTTTPAEVSEATPVEPPTPLNLITATASGFAKRTPVHFYARQRRGGMGIFDLDTPAEDPPAILTLAEDSEIFLLLTSYARVFRLQVSAIPETPIRARGETIIARLNLAEDETVTSIQPVRAQGYLVLLSKTGMLRSLRHHIFGDYMKPGLSLYDIKSFGPLASSCWTPGDGDLFIATHQGRAIRFPEKLVPPQGCLGIRLAPDDSAVAVTPVYHNSEVFLLGADGRGTIRDMETFNPNKSPGSGGKNAMATSHLVSVLNIDGADDVFIISKLGKIIRFQLAEVPVKDGVVQGVNCMSFRADEAVALIARRPVLPY
jgi:DNA gyrase/topoisomerase IV subunit A